MYSERWIHLSAGARWTQPQSDFDTCGEQSKAKQRAASPTVVRDPDDITDSAPLSPLWCRTDCQTGSVTAPGGRRGAETASESYHTKGEETRCQCPPEMWAPEIAAEQNKCIGVSRSTYLIHKACEPRKCGCQVLRGRSKGFWANLRACE